MKNGFRIVLYCKCHSSEERGTSSLVGLDLLFFLFKESTSYFPIVWAVKPLVIYHLGIPATASSLPDCTGHPRAHREQSLAQPLRRSRAQNACLEPLAGSLCARQASHGFGRMRRPWSAGPASLSSPPFCVLLPQRAVYSSLARALEKGCSLPRLL